MKHKHHIIPRHAGGTDDSSNIIELTPEEHAEAHRKLYEEHGRWQDYVAWQGLAKLSEKKDLVKLRLSEAGKMGAKHNHKRKGMKYNRTKPGNYNDRSGANNPCARTYEVTHPCGKVETVVSLKTWCEDVGLNYNSFNAQINRGRPHKGFTAIRKP